MSKLRRILHVLFGHNVHESEVIETQRFRLHPNNYPEAVFTVNLMHCPCGLCWLDDGFEARNPYALVKPPGLKESAHHARQMIYQKYEDMR